jgi:hypothetical protein
VAAAFFVLREGAGEQDRTRGAQRRPTKIDLPLFSVFSAGIRTMDSHRAGDETDLDAIAGVMLEFRTTYTKEPLISRMHPTLGYRSPSEYERMAVLS